MAASEGSRLDADAEAARFAYGEFRSAPYLRHNARRQEHLASLGLDLRGKSVLEVGAGVGDHTTFFLDRGCSVVSLEPRDENCRVFEMALAQLAETGYEGLARHQLVQGEVASLDDCIRGSFEVVYCYGLLYHLADPLAALQALSRRSTELLLLETRVSFGAHEAINPEAEQAGHPTQAVGGMGCRPTRPWLFARLKELFAHAYVPRTQPSHDEFPVDWTAPPAEEHAARAVFVASRRPLENPALLDYLPERQERC